MKPFDLDAALAGSPVVTRDGLEVTQLTKFELGDSQCCLCGVLAGVVGRWHLNGRATSLDSTQRLFMAPAKKTGWIARYASGVIYSTCTETLDECEALHPHASTYHQIEWEE